MMKTDLEGFHRFLAACCGAILVLALLYSTVAYADGSPVAGADDDQISSVSGDDDRLFARRISGTWMEPIAFGGGASWTMNINASGTLIWWGSWFFGDGGEFFNGAVFGSWRRSGPFTIDTIQVGYLNDGEGTFEFTGRVRQTFTFSEDLQTFTYEGFEDLFTPDQDPTDPDEVPVDSFEFSGGPFKRLTLD